MLPRKGNALSPLLRDSTSPEKFLIPLWFLTKIYLHCNLQNNFVLKADFQKMVAIDI